MEDSSNNTQDDYTTVESNTANPQKNMLSLASQQFYTYSSRNFLEQRPLHEIDGNNVTFESAILANDYDKHIYSVSNPIRNDQFANERYLNVNDCEVII